MTFDELLAAAKAKIPTLAEDRVRRAYEMAEAAHAGQVRISGEPYIHHPLEVSANLLRIYADEETLIAALLHDVLEDTDTCSETIEAAFGRSVRLLAEGVEKLSKIEAQGEDRQLGSLRKMFLAMANDIRVIFIKLADRLHNMRTIGVLKPEKQQRIAKETLDIYAPIATRLGMYEVKGELEDLSFCVLFPHEYAEIERQLGGQAGKRDRVIASAKRELETALRHEGIEVSIQGRVKHSYSIYRKMLKNHEQNIEAITDIFALRIIAGDEAECYHILGVIHKYWKPLSHRFKDYIAVPKPNGYQSLHTTVLGLIGGNATRPIEIQIRTREMHERADKGAAAHWQYKERGDSRLVPTVSNQKKAWLDALVDLGSQLSSNAEYSENLHLDLFQDRIFIFTPTGDIIDLPCGATPVDFAYAIHTNIGDSCVGAVVNGKSKPLNTELHSGEVVKVLTKKNQIPNPYWLSFVVTSHAKQSIKSWLKNSDIGELVRTGRDLLNRHLARMGKPELDARLSLLKPWKGQSLNLPEREQILQRIGNGSLSVTEVLSDLFPPARNEKRQVFVPSEKNNSQNTPVVLVEGDATIETKLASCCNPTSADRIGGVVTRGRAIMIHKIGCKNFQNADGERVVGARWSTDPVETIVKIRVDYLDRIGILRDITNLLSEHGLNIVQIELSTNYRSRSGLLTLAFEVLSDRNLDRILDAIEHTKSIRKMEVVEKKEAM